MIHTREHLGFEVIKTADRGYWVELTRFTLRWMFWKIYIIASKIPKQHGWEKGYGNSILRVVFKLHVKGIL